MARRGMLSLILFLLPALSVAQQLLNFGNGALPQCAQNCQLLQEAQSLCIPPTAPQGPVSQYKACFCNSNYLQPLKTSPNGVCNQVCGQSDLQAVQSWFNGFCNNPNSLPATTSTAAPPPPATTSTPGTSAASQTAGSLTTQDSTDNGPWMQTHWRWVLMLIIIFVALIGISILGVWLKRRHKRRHNRAKGFNDTVTASPLPTSNPAAMRSVDVAPMAPPSGTGRTGSRSNTLTKGAPDGRSNTLTKSAPDSAAAPQMALGNVQEEGEERRSRSRRREK